MRIIATYTNSFKHPSHSANCTRFHIAQRKLHHWRLRHEALLRQGPWVTQSAWRVREVRFKGESWKPVEVWMVLDVLWHFLAAYESAHELNSRMFRKIETDSIMFGI